MNNLNIRFDIEYDNVSYNIEVDQFYYSDYKGLLVHFWIDYSGFWLTIIDNRFEIEGYNWNLSQGTIDAIGTKIMKYWNNRAFL